MMRTKVTNSLNSKVFGADILEKNSSHLKVIIDGTDEVIRMKKDTPTDKIYVGRIKNVEFYSSGE